VAEPVGELLVEDEGRVRFLTLNRPERRNAVTFTLLDALVDAFLAADADPSVGCVVLRGAGSSFCSGMDLDPNETDLDFSARSIGQELGLLDRFRRLESVWDLRTPTIASVHGHCVGAGTDLAFHCDMVLCSTEARFGYPPVRSMGAPPTHMWTYLAGPQWAKRLLLTGDAIDGETAARAGFALEAVPPAELADRTRVLATRVASVPPEVAAANKAIVNKVVGLMGRHLAQELAREANAMAHHSPDAQEFGRVAAEQGFKAANAWQQERYGG
jgi:enoyl-CoA hydratase